jgi:hypothetical protein
MLWARELHRSGALPMPARPNFLAPPARSATPNTRAAEVMEATFAKVRQYAKQRRCVGGGNAVTISAATFKKCR